MEQDVSKVLQETVPTTRSLGAIPKKIKNANHNIENEVRSSRRVMKSESDRARRRQERHEERNSARNRSMKESKLTQTLKQNDSSVEGLECLVMPLQQQPRLRKLSSTRKSTKVSRQRNEGYQEPSASTSSNNELSTLLPAPPLLQAFLNSRRECMLPVYLPANSATSETQCRLKRTGANRNRTQCYVPPATRTNKRETAIASSLSTGHGTHCAKSFNDTSDGSVHCFMDETGKWVTYTFDEKGLGTANTSSAQHSNKLDSVKVDSFDQTGSNKEIWENNSTESEIGTSSISEILSNSKTAGNMIPHVRLNMTRLQNQVRPTHRNGDNQREDFLVPDFRHFCFFNEAEAEPEMPMPKNKFRFIQAADTLNNNYPRTKSYYKYKVFPWIYVKVTLDRLKLLALLDRNLTLSETLLSIVLSILVAVFGAVLLFLGFYEDLSAFVFCFIIASCQYSLLKSVQPDAASPTHGFNRIIAYSRPVYFCIFSAIVLLLHANISEEKTTAIDFYAMTFTDQDVLIVTRDFFTKFILFFPFLFSLGLFPQINTFLLYFLEQVDMYLFGGNAMSSLLAAFYCIFRSVSVVLFLFGLSYAALCEPKGSQHVLFSIFCACLVSSTYHLSRSASDPTNLWNILVTNLWSPDMYSDRKTVKKPGKTGKEEEKGGKEKEGEPQEEVKQQHHEDELCDPLPHKLQKTVHARLKNDVLLCTAIALLVFGIHASTVFTALQPELSPVLRCTAAIFGFFVHYVIPQLRKQLPWLCIARPFLRPREYTLFHIRGPAQIMWFERVSNN